MITDTNSEIFATINQGQMTHNIQTALTAEDFPRALVAASM